MLRDREAPSRAIAAPRFMSATGDHRVIPCAGNAAIARRLRVRGLIDLV
jgi:hypothetical protein